MGKCPNCGNKRWFLRTYKCFVCEREGCENCLSPLLTFPFQGNVSRWWVCSDKCRQSFKEMLIAKIPRSAISLARYPSAHPHPEFKPTPSDLLYKDALTSIIRDRDEQLFREIDHIQWVRMYTGDYYRAFKQYCDLKQAENLKRAGRREEAAKIFDQYDMYDEARELRDREKQVVVKRTDISVNLNALLKEIKDGGIVAVYRCPNCGGKLKVGKDTNVESLKVCEHCGSEIEALDLADFLKTALS